MPYGLSNPAASVQIALNVILTMYKWEACLSYLDDTIIIWNSVEEHIGHDDNILFSLKEADVTHKIKKCKSFTNNAECLVHPIRPGKHEIVHTCTASLKHAVCSTKKSELRSFLEL